MGESVTVATVFQLATLLKYEARRPGLADKPRYACLSAGKLACVPACGFRFSHPATNGNSPKAFAFRLADLCGMGESNSRLNFGRVVFYH